MVYLPGRHLYPYKLASSKLITLHTIFIHILFLFPITVRLSKQHLSTIKWEKNFLKVNIIDQIRIITKYNRNPSIFMYNQTSTEVQVQVKPDFNRNQSRLQQKSKYTYNQTSTETQVHVQPDFDRIPSICITRLPQWVELEICFPSIKTSLQYWEIKQTWSLLQKCFIQSSVFKSRPAQECLEKPEAEFT